MITTERFKTTRSASDESTSPTGWKNRQAAKPAHILVVDDDPAIRHLIAQLLQGAGYQVSCAGDGEEGWTCISANNVDLLICDHDMPLLSGLNLLRRTRSRRLNLPAILISGRMPWNESDLPHLLQPGAAIEKPFSAVMLLTKVRDLLPAHLAPKQGASVQRLAPRRSTPSRVSSAARSAR